MRIFQVDAFSDRVFKGNPAAVIPLHEWPEDMILQQIAAENNLSETAFFSESKDGSYKLRWFTPQTEVDLCGHATLASAHILFEQFNYSKQEITFHTKSGKLKVTKRYDLYIMDFPSNPPKPVPVPKLLPEAIGIIPIYTGVNIDMLVLVQSERDVQDIKPDMPLLKKMEVRGVIVTAPADDPETDFVSRFFAPAVGVPEDPVTGSAHTVLTPFWVKRLGKSELRARQISTRGGELICNQKDGRVEIGGKAVTYMAGEITI
ncbi:MAG: PhzF family phenazine biosynthesis protein [Balneolaceae bacterium]|nr:MAG: PhzF family phenazine biosynthesis protein [Balneolaceae bacterium]